jgi:hypothetical protein
LYLGFWFAQQLFEALGSRNHSTGVAYTAHVGGFIAGAILGKIIASDYESSVVDPVLARRQQAIGRSTEANGAPMRFCDIPVEAQSLSKGFHAGQGQAGKRGTSVSEEPLESETSPGQAAERAGWESLDRNDPRQAARCILVAMGRYIETPELNRERLLDLLKKIIKQRERLVFSQNQYYQWGKQLDVIREFKYAIVCFDIAAFLEGNAHIRKNSLIEASRLRLQTAYQLDKVRRDMELLLTIDSQGIFADQARAVLRQLQGISGPM